MSDKISSVVFDLGGVLIDWDPRHLYKKLLSDEPDRIEWFLTNVCTSEWNALQDAGRSLAQATEELLIRHPEHRDLIEAYYGRWEEMIGGPIPGTVEVLREVRDSPYGLFALTNWSAETFPVAKQRFDFLNWFDGVVVSGEIGLIKPDPAIFHYLTDTFEIEPSSAVFIDDLPTNVEAARRLGFRGIRFETPDQLRSDLRRLGVELINVNERA